MAVLASASQALSGQCDKHWQSIGVRKGSSPRMEALSGAAPTLAMSALDET